MDSAAREAEDYLHRLQSETKQAEDLRIALEEEREATAEKYARLDIEFRKKEKARRKEFDSELSSTISSFERKSKDFIKTVEDKKERKRLEKQLATNKAELKRQAFEVETKRQEKPVAENKNDEIQVEDRPIEVGVRRSFKTLRHDRKGRKDQRQKCRCDGRLDAYAAKGRGSTGRFRREEKR